MEFWAGLLPPTTPLSRTRNYVRAAGATTGIDLTTVGNTLPSQTPTLVSRMIVFTTLHELGHATGARHHQTDEYMQHYNTLPRMTQAQKDAAAAALQEQYFVTGDRSCPMRYWHFEPAWLEVLQFMSGHWTLLTPAAGGEWKFCSDELSTMRLKP